VPLVAASRSEDVRTLLETRVLQYDDGRGSYTLAGRSFAKEELIFQEPALLLVYPSRDPPWRAALRVELKCVSADCAWQYCMAVHCLPPAQLPVPLPEGLKPLSEEARRRLLQLCGESPTADEAPSELAVVTARHLIELAAGDGGRPFAPRGGADGLARALDGFASRLSRNAFEVTDLKARPPTAADAIFHRISFFNHCCAGGSTSTWTWNGGDGLLSVKTTGTVALDDELTISYIGRPWSHLSRQARRRYLKQNYNFDCLCKSCSQRSVARGPGEHGSEEARGGGPMEGGSKLVNLLRRYVHEEAMGEADDGGTTSDASPQSGATAANGGADGGAAAATAAVGSRSEAKATSLSSASPRAKAPLTEEGRLERVLQRCLGEGLLQVSAELALQALREEEGHVGKTMIKLRRQCRSAAS